MNSIDLNADLAEGFGLYSFGADAALIDLITSANIACGFHAGDSHQMRMTVERCMERGVAIGAHPGLPDREGFGRRFMQVTPQDACDYVLYQVGALQAFVYAAGGQLSHVKLHGALYNMAAEDRAFAAAIVKGISSLDSSLLLFGLPKSKLAEEAASQGLRFIAEGFADRAYREDGMLVPRQVPGAVIHAIEEVAAQAVSLAVSQEAATLQGGSVKLQVNTICLHGDAEHAEQKAKSIRQALQKAGVNLQKPTK